MMTVDSSSTDEIPCLQQRLQAAAVIYSRACYTARPTSLVECREDWDAPRVRQRRKRQEESICIIKVGVFRLSMIRNAKTNATISHSLRRSFSLRGFDGEEVGDCEISLDTHIANGWSQTKKVGDDYIIIIGILLRRCFILELLRLLIESRYTIAVKWVLVLSSVSSCVRVE